MARPSRRSPTVASSLVTAFHGGANDEDACAAAGIATRTFYYWLASDAGFALLVFEARNEWKRREAARLRALVYGPEVAPALAESA